MKKIISERAVKCPDCGVLTPRVFLAGKQALCINSKCLIERFTVQDYETHKLSKDENRRNKSYNNSGRR